MKTLVRPIQPKPTPRFWLGINLHRCRLNAGMTQVQLAKAANLSSRRLRDIENASPESNPQLNTITALAEALKVDISVFFKHVPDSELLEV